jgi:hypothetical protein
MVGKEFIERKLTDSSPNRGHGSNGWHHVPTGVGRNLDHPRGVGYRPVRGLTAIWQGRDIMRRHSVHALRGRADGGGMNGAEGVRQQRTGSLAQGVSVTRHPVARPAQYPGWAGETSKKCRAG